MDDRYERLVGDVETVEDVRRVVHEEFVRWYNADTAGPASLYRAVAEDIWTALRR